MIEEMEGVNLELAKAKLKNLVCPIFDNSSNTDDDYVLNGSLGTEKYEHA